jgi:hypothetical protein
VQADSSRGPVRTAAVRTRRWKEGIPSSLSPRVYLKREGHLPSFQWLLGDRERGVPSSDKASEGGRMAFPVSDSSMETGKMAFPSLTRRQKKGRRRSLFQRAVGEREDGLPSF